MIHAACVWIALAGFAAAAVRDLFWRTIDNIVVGIVILAWGGMVATGGWGSGDIWPHVATAIVAFFVMLSCYLPKWVGGGDVKLMVAVMIWAGPEQAVPVLSLIALAGLALALAMLIVRMIRRIPLLAPVTAVLVPLAPERGVPYGIALAFGGGMSVLSNLAGS